MGRCDETETYSKPASPVRLASLVGFSNRQSSPACLHRRQGGFSAPSHLIFCFRQAFYGSKWRVSRIPFEDLRFYTRKHLAEG